MRELSMHILDLAQNCIVAGASTIEIDVVADTLQNQLTIRIADNGRGMEPEFAENSFDPFVTTRTTRRVGLGIPMFSQAAVSCDGVLKVWSKLGEGTKIEARFRLDHIDRAPLGDIAATIVALVAANPSIDFRYRHGRDDSEFVFDTKQVKAELDGVPITESSVIRWVCEYIKDNTSAELQID